MTTTVLRILGMRDNRCRELVAAALEGVGGVREVDVSLYLARARIVHDAPLKPADLLKAVRLAGYAAEVEP